MARDDEEKQRLFNEMINAINEFAVFSGMETNLEEDIEFDKVKRIDINPNKGYVNMSV